MQGSKGEPPAAGELIQYTQNKLLADKQDIDGKSLELTMPLPDTSEHSTKDEEKDESDCKKAEFADTSPRILKNVAPEANLLDYLMNPSKTIIIHNNWTNSIEGCADVISSEEKSPSDFYPKMIEKSLVAIYYIVMYICQVLFFVEDKDHGA